MWSWKRMKGRPERAERGVFEPVCGTEASNTQPADTLTHTFPLSVTLHQLILLLLPPPSCLPLHVFSISFVSIALTLTALLQPLRHLTPPQHRHFGKTGDGLKVIRAQLSSIRLWCVCVCGSAPSPLPLCRFCPPLSSPEAPVTS